MARADRGCGDRSRVEDIARGTVSTSTAWAHDEGAISSRREAQITRHIKQALKSVYAPNRRDRFSC